MLDFRDIWVVLVITASRGSIRIEYRDGSGRVSGPVEIAAGKTLSLPDNFNKWIASQLKELPTSRNGMRNDGPIPLPVFVKVKGTLTWSELIQSLQFRGIPPDRLQFVHLTRSKKPGRQQFHLPFYILTLGPPARFGLLPLLRRHWLVSDPLMRRGGLVVRRANSGNLRQKLRGERQDVLFVGGMSRAYALHVIAGMPVSHKPRLIVDCSEKVLSVPEGTSLLHAPGESLRGSLGTEVLFALIHDLPLHEMLKAVTRKMQPSESFSLYSNPAANQDLRILDAYLDVHRQATRIESLATGFHPAAFERIHDVAPALRNIMVRNSGKARALGAGATMAVRSVSSFTHESSGLTLLAGAGHKVDRATNDWKGLESQLRTLHANKDAVHLLEETQRRAVDVALERAETNPFYSPISRKTSLQAGARYILRIHVGNALPGSLMKDPPPPVDPLLPPKKDSDGYDLTVAVQEKEFKLLSSNRQPLFLPRLGGSNQVYFPVRAPRQKGQATLRILLYYKNQLLQAFLLRSLITSSERENGKSITLVELEFSQTARFMNLPALKPRALSVVANDNLDGTHEFFLFGKSAGKAALGDEVYVDAMEAIRVFLKEASLAPGTTNQERVFPLSPAGNVASPVAADFLRKLADKGRDVYRGMFLDVDKGTTLPVALRRLRDLEGETIQIIRLQKRLVIPWSLLYDYELPETKSGDVCLGLTKNQGGAVVPCSHGAKDKVYCIKGFWGVRHIVEERIANGSNDDVVQSVAALPKAKPLCVAMDVTVPGVDNLRNDFVTELGAAKVEGPVDAALLLKLLWEDPPERPTVLVVVGHLETKPPVLPSEPKADRIVLVRNKSWLTHEAISDQVLDCNKAWEQPRPLVLLMACSSAATNVSKMNDFVLALNQAGAGAIVGTECLVFANLICPFAKRLTLGMWKATQKASRITLGQAMRAYRMETLQSGNPLAFVFRSIGNSDLVLDT